MGGQSEVVPKLELRGVAKRYGAVGAVAGIELSVAAGESVVLLGPSGCGKTTTLRLIAGFITPDAGQILIDGRIVADGQTAIPPERRNLGMVFQSYAVWPHKTVFQNVAYGLVVARRSRPDIEARVNDVLDLVKLTGTQKRYPGELSGGQQQRVALARALVTEPRILLLDEPLSNLDARLREEMRLELKELHARTGMTTIYVTHDQGEALVLADRVVVMNRGAIEQIGSPQQVYLDPATRFVADFIGNTNFVDAVIVAINDGDQGITVASELGVTLPAQASPELRRELKAGDRVTLSIRPEAVRVMPADPAAGQTTAGRLLKTVFVGSRYEVWVDVRGRQIRAEAHALERFGGDDVSVAFDPRLIRIVRR